MREPDDMPPELAHVHVPDDARELDADRIAYYRELLARSRGEAPPARPTRPGPPAPAPTPDGIGGRAMPPWSLHPAGTGRTRAWGGSAMAAALSVVALLAGLLVVLMPRPAATPDAMPLASPSASPGEIGGLLPDAPMVIGTQTRALRDARPAVLVLPPAGGCDETCRKALEDVDTQAGMQRVRTVLVGPPDQQAVLAETARAMGGVPVVLDPDDAMRRAFAPTGLTIVLVASDGVVKDVQRDVAPGIALLPTLAALAPPLAATPLASTR